MYVGRPRVPIWDAEMSLNDDSLPLENESCMHRAKNHTKRLHLVAITLVSSGCIPIPQGLFFRLGHSKFR